MAAACQTHGLRGGGARLAGPAIAAVRNCPERCKDRWGFKEGEEAPLEDRGAQVGRGQGGCDPGAREGEVLRGSVSTWAPKSQKTEKYVSD